MAYRDGSAGPKLRLEAAREELDYALRRRHELLRKSIWAGAGHKMLIQLDHAVASLVQEIATLERMLEKKK